MCHYYFNFVSLLDKNNLIAILFIFIITEITVFVYISKLFKKKTNSTTLAVQLSWLEHLPNPGVSTLLVSLCHTGRRVVFGHTLNTLWHITKKKFIMF